MTYRQAAAYLDTLVNYEKKISLPGKRSFKLERMRDFLSAIGDPQEALKCIHIAGTKGKGSTAVFTASMLRACGYRVGLYTSPHLSDVRERIRVLRPGSGSRRRGAFEGMIGRKAYAALISAMKPRIERFGRMKCGRLSYFEVLTAIAFEYFRAQKVDFAVLETGLGGRLDATNTVKPLLSAITSIGYDHQDVLGSTLAAIAGEKAGIIKAPSRTFARRRLPVVTAPQPREAMNVLRQRCRRRQAQLFSVGGQCVIRQVLCDARGARFSLRSPCGALERLRIRLAGRHQVTNAAVAVSILLVLRAEGWVRKNVRGLRAGLAAAQWPGRMEAIAARPTVLLDGAHNQDSAQALAAAVRTLYPRTRKTMVLGISQDKDALAICRQLVPCAHTIVATRAAHARALAAAELNSILRGCLRRVPGRRILHSADSSAQALRIAAEASGEKGLIIVCGSLFLVAEARRLLK